MDSTGPGEKQERVRERGLSSRRCEQRTEQCTWPGGLDKGRFRGLVDAEAGAKGTERSGTAGFVDSPARRGVLSRLRVM